MVTPRGADPVTPVRVLAVMEAYTVTGPAKNLLRFAGELPSGTTKGAEFVIATFVRRSKVREETGLSNSFVDAARRLRIDVEVVRERYRFDPAVISQLKEALGRHDPDIVQTHGVKSHFLVSLLRPRWNRRWIAFHHGYTAVDMKMRTYNKLDRWSLPRADRVVTVCQAFTQTLQRAGVRADRIRVVPNSIDLEQHVNSETVRTLRFRLRADSEDRLILAVGRLSREKAHADLIAALGRLRGARSDLHFRLVLVGDGPERKALERDVIRVGLSDRVLFEGHQPDVAPYYRSADLFALPSRSEGSPNVLLEAMAAGLPIVATEAGGIPEMVEHGISALLVPAGDPDSLSAAVCRLLTDSSLRINLSAGARAAARRFTPQAQTQALLSIYRELHSLPVTGHATG